MLSQIEYDNEIKEIRLSGTENLFGDIMKKIGPNYEVKELIEKDKRLNSPYIPKLEIIILHDNFNRKPHDNIKLCILPIPVFNK